MRKFLALAFFLTSATIFAQGVVTGTVIDSDMDAPLPGANVRVEGSTQGTVTDFGGLFNLEVDKASGFLEISYVGFETKRVPFTVANGQTVDLGRILLAPDADALEEVIVTTYSIAIDRKTPVAVSTIRAEAIETQLGNQEFPEILKSTPGVYATKGGGGFGDSEIRLRGFESENIAVLINGIPVNDMENGRVYWSNWAGLSDVTRFMQVQRGLGASKVAVPSIGGTINIVTRTTDAEEGGSAFYSLGNDGYQKISATVSTGKMDNGWAATVSGARTTGDGYVDGTEFSGFSYFVNIAKDFNEDHQLSFTAFGAQQRHGQRQNALPMEIYRISERGTRFNQDWGYRNGEVLHVEDNFYHKPQMSLNHYWDISEDTQLSTSAYASFGSGGGGGFTGVNKFGLGTAQNPSPYRDGYLQPINFDLIVEENVARGALGSETYLRASRNDHQWYGVLSTLSSQILPNVEFTGGLDFRYYQGEHFTEVTDLLGGAYVLDTSNDNNPLNAAGVGDKILYHDIGTVLWEGLFAQAEYDKNNFSAFVTLAASNTSYKRKDFFNYLDSDPAQETDYQHFFGYSGKGGANYNLDSNNNIFANIGYFEKAPFSNAVFLNFRNDINTGAENQKIFSAELGYGYRSANFRADLNVYRTAWNDKTLVQRFQNPDNTTGSANILGLNALHQGVELEFSYRPIENLTLTGMASVGDWTWKNDITDVAIYDEEQNLVRTINLYVADLKVGGSAQTTFAAGADYEVWEGTKVRVDWNYYDDLYAEFDPETRSTRELGQSWELPEYGLVDFGVTHKFDIGDLEAMLIGNVNNVLDTEYISIARGGLNDGVFYGFGRTFNVGAKINF
ncbi:TonB-dependent receptor [Salinimicrobium oceani]|uniref:TonB-dependent receptor plug domain-containing protein n=1 Tax=Salinimicrobium oceani TaxID=2722702 RepID=A0ABX1CXB5_9FLAO|nr:TonB-dependent receptor [Salinimicrobium oceani]NJW52894.1 TonB-dependent receptor plug domain-containing protein [Salinimicrobium oceani]